MEYVKEMPGNVFYLIFFKTQWRNIGCSMLSDLELETSDYMPTHPPTAYWHNTGRISSTGLTVNAPPGTGDTFNYNNLMWRNCPCSQMVQNIPLHWLNQIPDVLWNMKHFETPLPLHLGTVKLSFQHTHTHTVASRGIKIKWTSQWTSKESCGNWRWI